MKLVACGLVAVLCFSGVLRYFYSLGRYQNPIQTKAECEQFNEQLREQQQEPLLDCNDRSLTIPEPWRAYGNIMLGFYVWKMHMKHFLRLDEQRSARFYHTVPNSSAGGRFSLGHPRTA